MFLKVISYRITGEKMCTEKCDLIRNINLVDVGRSIGRILCRSFNPDIFRAMLHDVDCRNHCRYSDFKLFISLIYNA